MVVATGFFDGVHLGHRLVISQLVEAAALRSTESVVATFWPHPRNVLQQDASQLRLLTTLKEKKRFLTALGVDRVEVLDFTKEFSRLSAREYLEKYVMGCFGGTAIVLGYDNRMGGDSATREEVRAAALSLGLEVIDIPERRAGDNTVSSTRIRAALASSDVELAAEMLGYRYSLQGVVVGGDGLGRKLGFPTANMQLYDPLKQIPGPGVYLVEVHTLGRRLHGMCNIGVRPTVTSSGTLCIETNIFDFSEDIYGLDIEISFIRRIRSERKFDSLGALTAQLALDREACLALL